jgi:hypothetical protein
MGKYVVKKCSVNCFAVVNASDNSLVCTYDTKEKAEKLAEFLEDENWWEKLTSTVLNNALN